MNSRTITIYHNPRCSKSRKAMDILKSRGIEPEIVDYTKQPPNEETLRQLLRALGLEAEQLVRKNDQSFKDMQLGDKKLSSEEWLNILLENPSLLQRPIIMVGEKAIIGRPPEQVLELLDNL